MEATLTNTKKPEEVVTFKVPPQKINRGFQTEYSKLSVLATSQPLLWYQNSVTTLSLPGLLLFGEGTGRDIALLEQWTKPVEGELEPPTLKFNFAHIDLPRVKLESAEVVEDMWVGGASPTRAEVSLSLLLYPEPPAVKTAPIPKPEGTNVKLSAPEKLKYALEVTKKVKADPKYKYKQGDVVAITDQNRVTLNDKDIGALTDFVTLEKKHTPPTGKEEPKKAPPTKPDVQTGKSSSKV